MSTLGFVQRLEIGDWRRTRRAIKRCRVRASEQWACYVGWQKDKRLTHLK